jgi:signal transduction histidine kinase
MDEDRKRTEAAAEDGSSPGPPGALWRSLVLVVTVAIIVGGWATYVISDYRTQQHDRAREILTRAAFDDAVEMGRWLDEGFTDASVMATQSGVAERYVRWQKGEDPNFPKMLADRLTAERDIREYDCISMFTKDEWPFATTTGDRCSDRAFKCSDFASRAVDSEEPMFEDHFHNAVGAWCVAWSGPVRLDSSAPVVGVIVYTVQVRDSAMRVIGDEVLPYDSGQVALVRRHDEGFDIITSANGFEPMTVGEGPQLHALLAEDLATAESTIRVGQNEDGTAVIAAARRVPRTEWFVASRADISEVNEPVWRFAGLVGVSSVLVVIIFALGILTVWRVRMDRYREHLAFVELRQALDARDRFMRNMSHELRTPLQSIMGFTSIMLSGMAGPVNDEQTRQLGMVDASAKRLLALVDDVLDLDRMRDHGVKVSAKPFASDELAQAVAGAMRPISECKSLDCRLVHDGPPMELVTDRAMVERIVLNLLSNAIKFTEAGFVELAVRPDGADHVIFEVTDSGRGIPAEDLERVMEEFHQVVEPDGVKPVGTGLGLPISRRMAEALGGELTVTSESGVGSCFRLRIPRVYAGRE